MVAQLCDESEFETLQEKLEDWADPNSKDASGESTVHAALTSGNADAMAKRAKVLCRVLESWAFQSVSSGSQEFRGDPEAATEEGNSALKVAAMRGNPTAAKALLDAGAAVGGTDDEGRGPQTWDSRKNSNSPSHGLLEMRSVQVLCMSPLANFSFGSLRQHCTAHGRCKWPCRSGLFAGVLPRLPGGHNC
eukprot:Skav206520  [mRNA]  locus=scaffold2251:340478:341657:- [translate_table: standard]